jgi:hypothetical protein
LRTLTTEQISAIKDWPIWHNTVGIITWHVVLLLWAWSIGLNSSAIAQQVNTLSFHKIDAQLAQAQAISSTEFGVLFIAETGKNRILISDSLGIRTDSIGTLGLGAYQFDQPVDLDATNGLRIYVADKGNERIQVFDRRKQYLTSIRAARGDIHGPYKPTSVASNVVQELYFYNEMSRTIVKLNRNGEWDTSFGMNGKHFERVPRDLGATEEHVYVLAEDGRKLHRFSSGGTYKNFWQLSSSATAIRLQQDKVWILYPQMLELHTQRGRVLKQFRFQLDKHPMDLALIDNQCFVITSSALFKCDIP